MVEFALFVTDDMQAVTQSGELVYDVLNLPLPPINLDVEGAANRNILTWEPSPTPDLLRYRIYRDGARIDSVDANITTYTDNNVVAGRRYAYQVTSISQDLRETRLSTSPEQEATPFSYPSGISHNYQVSFGDATLDRSSRMVGIPGEVNTRLADTFTGVAGTDWNAYFDNGAPENYLVEYTPTGGFNFTRGRGYWVISHNAWNVSGRDSSVALPESNNVTIPLHAGWNIITNPYNQTVRWSEVITANNITDDLWGFNGNYFKSSTLEPYTGYYLINRSNLPEELTIPFPGATSNKQAPSSASTDSSDIGWLTIYAIHEDIALSAIHAGIHEEASQTLDRHDQFAPPGAFTPVAMYFQNESLETAHKRLASEFKPPHTAGLSFELIVNNTLESPVELEISGVDVFATQEVYLVDQATAKFYNLHTSQEAITPSEPTAHYTLLIGSAGFIDEQRKHLLPDSYQLHASYPNPFRTQTTIEYSIPDTPDANRETRLEVYNVLGQRVAILVNEIKAPGYHKALWNAESLATGMYFIRLKSGSFVETQSVVRVK